MNTTNEVNAQEVKTQEGVWVEIPTITVPEDARKHSPDDIDSRAVSLTKDGQLENILLSKEGDQLVLVYGNGRLESAKKAGWEKIRADIKEGLTESQKLLMTLAENEEREDASPFYTASLHQRLMETEHLTHEQLATQLGKAKVLVDKYSTLMAVPSEVRPSCNALQLSLRQCLEIAKLTKVEDQVQVMKECATQDLAGKALEARVKQLLNPKPAVTETPEHGSPEAQPFQFTRKGKRFVICSEEIPENDMLDLYMTHLRWALSEFLNSRAKEAAKAA